GPRLLETRDRVSPAIIFPVKSSCSDFCQSEDCGVSAAGSGAGDDVVDDSVPGHSGRRCVPGVTTSAAVRQPVYVLKRASAAAGGRELRGMAARMDLSH